MDSALLEIGILFFLILLNGFFALAEIALISARKSRLQHLAEHGNRRARMALELAGRPDQMLAAVQIGVTLIGILTGALSGATVARRLAAGLAELPALAPYADPLSVAVVVILLTFFSLVLGELVPKQLALHSPERLALALAGSMGMIARLTSPLVRFLSGSSNLVIRILGIHPSQEPPVTPEEIKVLVEQGTQAGAIEEAEQDMVEGVFRLGEQRVEAIMTPRPDVDWIDLEDSPDAIRDHILHSHRTRFPVAQGDLDNLQGILHTKDLLAHGFSCDASDLRKILRPAIFVPESAEALHVLEQFKRSGEHFALVTDEFGSVAGVISSTNILEAIVGDLPAAGEPVEPEVVRRADGTLLLGGTLSIDEMKDLLELDNLPDEEESSFQTVGGFVMSWLGEIPQTGDHFEWGGFRFEVVDMDGRRVDKVLVTPEPPAEPAEQI
jgi:putative hemolysin